MKEMNHSPTEALSPTWKKKGWLVAFTTTRTYVEKRGELAAGWVSFVWAAGSCLLVGACFAVFGWVWGGVVWVRDPVFVMCVCVCVFFRSLY